MCFLLIVYRVLFGLAGARSLVLADDIARRGALARKLYLHAFARVVRISTSRVNRTSVDAELDSVIFPVVAFAAVHTVHAFGDGAGAARFFRFAGARARRRRYDYAYDYRAYEQPEANSHAYINAQRGKYDYACERGKQVGEEQHAEQARPVAPGLAFIVGLARVVALCIHAHILSRFFRKRNRCARKNYSGGELNEA